jgi:hypothetical protein
MGQTVRFTVTISNSGPSCNGTEPWFCGQSASIANASGIDVWDFGAGPQSPIGVRSCPADFVHVVRHGATNRAQFTWHQDRCTFEKPSRYKVPDPECRKTQVPAGRYTIEADSAATATITLTR